MTTSYLGFEIANRGGQWFAVRRTRRSIYRLSPHRTLREARTAIDRWYEETSLEDLAAL